MPPCDNAANSKHKWQTLSLQNPEEPYNKHSVERQAHKENKINIKKRLVLSATSYKNVNILSYLKNQYMINWTRIDAL